MAFGETKTRDRHTEHSLKLCLRLKLGWSKSYIFVQKQVVDVENEDVFTSIAQINLLLFEQTFGDHLRKIMFLSVGSRDLRRFSNL